MGSEQITANAVDGATQELTSNQADAGACCGDNPQADCCGTTAAAIGGDWEAARAVELVLPETGVSSVAGSAGDGADRSSRRRTAAGAGGPRQRTSHVS